MHYQTPRKLALGLGSARRGTADHWALTVTGVALAILTPFVVGIVSAGLHADRTGAIALFGRPVPAVVVGLFITIGMLHWIRGTASVIDDYLRGAVRTWALVLTKVFAWGVIGVVVFALVRLVALSASL